MMDRNREARRAAAMANGLPRRRHRSSTSGSLRDSPEHDGPLDSQETARLKDRTVKKDRDREMRDRERERDRDRDRLSRSKRRRGEKYMHGSNREEGGGDDSSEESVNDEDEDDDGPVRYVAPPNPVPPISSMSAASTLTTHRKNYPPPAKVFRAAPSWKAHDEMIGVSVPRKARSASTKRSHDCWSAGGGGGGGGEASGEQIHRRESSSPVRPTMTAAGTVPSPSQAPMSPTSSNVSMKKKLKASNGAKQRPPKSSSKSSPPSIQDEIEIEVAEVLYGLMRQSQTPVKQEAVSNDSAKFDSKEINRSTGDSKSRVSSPIPNSPSFPTHNSTSSAPPLTTVAPKRKMPRPYPEESTAPVGPRCSPISSIPRAEADRVMKIEVPLPSTEKMPVENGDLKNSHEPAALSEAMPVANNGVVSDEKASADESGSTDGLVKANVEEASASPKMESLDHNLLESRSTKTTSAVAEKENRREEKFDIDLMARPPQSRTSPEREVEGEYGGGAGLGDQKPMVTDSEAEEKPKPKANEEYEKSSGCRGVEFNAEGQDQAKANAASAPAPAGSEAQPQPPNLNSSKERNIDLQHDLEKADRTSSGVNDKLSLQLQKQPPTPPPQPPKTTTREEENSAQASSLPLPMSVPAAWPGGLAAPMGYIPPLQGVVSMDGTPMASTPIQPLHFMFSQPKPKRCATHCYIARSVSVHQQMMKMNPFWPAAAAAAAAGTAPLFGGEPYNLNMVPSPADLHAAAERGGASSAQDKGQAFAFFPGQPASSKDKSPPTSTAPDSSSQKKQQFSLQQSLPPAAASNILQAHTFIFPLGQQQAAASARPGSTKSPPTAGSAASMSTTSSAPMVAPSTAATPGPSMSFSYPNMGGNETQFMAILGNGAYPFPISAHVGAAPPYRGSPHQAMSFFNGSFYSSQMLQPSQLQQQQPAPPSQSLQIQQQNHKNASISTASSSSQKHQQLRPQGSGASGAGNPSSNSQNLQAAKGRPSQPHDMGGEDSPSTADSRTRQNLSVYGQNFTMPFHSPNFALITPPSSIGGSGSNAPGVPNSNHGDKKQQLQSQQQALKAGVEPLTPAFPMSFASINGATTPGLDISSMAHNHAILQSLPEAARHNYQFMAAAAAAQAAQHKKNSYRGPEDGKTGGGAAADPSNVDEERKAMAARASAASVGQSVDFSRDLAENSISTISANNVVESSARSLNLVPGSSARPNRSSGPHTVTNSNASNSQQQQQQQKLFPKQQQYVAATVAAARNKAPATSNGSVYPEHLTSASMMAAKFPNALPVFPPLVQGSGSPVQSPQWKSSVRPNTSQVSSPSVATSISSTMNMKNLPQQQGRPQHTHTQISFGAAAAATNTSSRPSSTSQGQQTTPNSTRVPSPPMMVGSPSTSSMSKSAGGSPRTTPSTSIGNKTGNQASTLSSQQGKNSPSPSLPNQKTSILGSPHIMSTSSTASKPQLQVSQQQPQLSKQSIQQAQLFFSNAYMQASVNSSAASAGTGYYLQRHRPENQQQQQGQKSQGSVPTTSLSGMLPLCTPVTLANASTSDPAKAVAAAAANSMKGGLPSQGLFQAPQFVAGSHTLVSAGFPYVHAVQTAVQVKSAEQKQPAGNDNLNACWQPEKK